MSTASSTLEGLRSGVRAPTLWLRRTTLSLLTLLVLLDLAGFLGVHTDTVSAQRSGYRLEATYPSIARAGRDTKWQVRLEHPGGFGDQLTLRITADYFDIYESQGWTPEPSAETEDGEYTYLSFAAPAGDTFLLDFDAYIQPSSQVGRDATISVMVDGHAVVSTHIDTRLLP